MQVAQPPLCHTKTMKLTTCLWFDGNARQAAEFYVANFPDSSIGSNWIAPGDTPGNAEGEEVFVDFKIFGHNFIGLNGGPSFKFTEAISFSIPCQDQAEIDHYWELLTQDGGEPGQCGWLKDKFGLSWQVTSTHMGQYIGGPDPDGAKRALNAMLQMTKINLEDLRIAYECA